MITTTPDVPVPARRFVPDGFDPAEMTPLVESLLAREPASGEELARWIEDWGEVHAAVFAAGGRRRIAMTRDTESDEKREAHVAYERDIIPLWRALEDRLTRRLLESPHRDALPARFAMFLRKKAVAAGIFCDENLPLQARDVELGTRYLKTVGALRVDVDGEKTVQEATRLLERPDRGLRERAWRATMAARAGVRATIEDLFDEQLALRHRMARQAGLPDYIAYRFKEFYRFDYTPADCAAFRDAVERFVVPAFGRCLARKKTALGLDRIRPWDLAVATGREPPSAQDEAALLRQTSDVLGAVDPVFRDEFEILVRNGLLDVWTRPGKAPGGYNHGLADIRLPFVFGNAAGGRGDLRLLLHEGGHAFHTIATRDEPVLGVARAPIEFCEVASMTMELFGAERMGRIYDEADARGVLASLLEERLRALAWIATIDGFQHWLYGHPGHAREEREAAWVALRTRFAPDVDYDGLEDARAFEWTAQGHLFNNPLYYIEYALAWIGAVQVWQRFREDPKAAVRDYRAALRLGGTRPLPELFAAAGARFGTDGDLLASVVAAMERRLGELTP